MRRNCESATGIRSRESRNQRDAEIAHQKPGNCTSARRNRARASEGGCGGVLGQKVRGVEGGERGGGKGEGGKGRGERGGGKGEGRQGGGRVRGVRTGMFSIFVFIKHAAEMFDGLLLQTCSSIAENPHQNALHISKARIPIEVVHSSSLLSAFLSVVVLRSHSTTCTCRSIFPFYDFMIHLDSN